MSEPRPVVSASPDDPDSVLHGVGQETEARPVHPDAVAGPDAPDPRPGPDAHRSAGLTEDEIVRTRADRPTLGWRGALLRATGGRLNPGVGAAEIARRDLLRRIARPLPGAHRIAVVSLKGGVGKTTVAACLGLALAEHRGDRVVALDADPDSGTLADRLTGDTAATVGGLLGHADEVGSLTDIARFTSLAGRLQVLASDPHPAPEVGLDRAGYERVCDVLVRFHDLVVTDCGTGFTHPAAAGVLGRADSVVVVGAPTVDGASRAATTLDRLAALGHGELAAGAVVVLSCDRAAPDVSRDNVREHFARRARAVVEVPADPHLATGARIEPDRLRPATREAFLELAAHVADGFAAGAP